MIHRLIIMSYNNNCIDKLDQYIDEFNSFKNTKNNLVNRTFIVGFDKNIYDEYNYYGRMFENLKKDFCQKK